MTGKNPFAGWQQAKQDKREALVREFLDYLKRSRVRCQYVTDLADMVSRHITEREGHGSADDGEIPRLDPADRAAARVFAAGADH